MFVETPSHWPAAKDRPPASSFPFETYKLTPPSGRHAGLLISIYDKNQPGFADPQFLKQLLRGDSGYYVDSADDLAKIDIQTLNLKGGLSCFVNFTDPDLVGKPVQKDSFKTSTPVILGLGTNYLIKITILCDQINGPDCRDAINIVESIKIKK